MRVVAGSNPVSNPLKVSSFGRAIGVSPIGSRFDSCTFAQNPLVQGYGHLVRDKAASLEAVSSGFFPVLRTVENV